jgi:phage terminase small subunit
MEYHRAMVKARQKAKRKLTTKQRRFVSEYLKDPNATRAAIKAGYSPRTARQMGAENLTKPAIKAPVQAQIAKFDIESEDILRGISRLAHSDLRKLYDEHGSLLPIHQLPDDVAAAIAGIEVVTRTIPGSDPVEVEHVVKIKLWDKTRALEMAGKYKKLFTERVELDVSDRLAARLRAARERRSR